MISESIGPWPLSQLKKAWGTSHLDTKHRTVAVIPMHSAVGRNEVLFRNSMEPIIFSNVVAVKPTLKELHDGTWRY